MHVMVTWDVGGGAAVPGDLNKAVKDALQGYSWVRPMRGVMIVRLTAYWERVSVVDALEKMAERYDHENGLEVRLLVSPLMYRGEPYDGYLREETWELVNERSG